MGQPRPLFHLFSVFSNKHHYNSYNKYMWKKVHPVYGAGIWTHDLRNVSLFPLRLDQCSRPRSNCYLSKHLLELLKQTFVLNSPEHRLSRFRVLLKCKHAWHSTWGQLNENWGDGVSMEIFELTLICKQAMQSIITSNYFPQFCVFLLFEQHRKANVIKLFSYNLRLIVKFWYL